MTAQRRNTLRIIFRCAWNMRRADGAVSMSEALKTAWAEHKAREAFYAKAATQPLRLVTLRSPIASPVERSVRRAGQPYAYTEARDRSRVTSALGR